MQRKYRHQLPEPNLTPLQNFEVLARAFQAVQRLTGWSAEMIDSHHRHEDLVFARWKLFYLVRKYSTLNGTQLGILLNRRPTQMSQLGKVIREELETNKKFRLGLEAAEALFIDYARGIIIARAQSQLPPLKAA
jgi:hypothetical protein